MTRVKLAPAPTSGKMCSPAADHLAVPGVSRWRTILRLAKLARSVARSGGPRQAARQVAYALSTEPWPIRRDVCAVLASLAARGESVLPSVADVLRDLDRLPKIEAPTHRRVRPRADRRDPLPVEAAKAVPIERVLDRYGLTLRRVGRELVGRCPFHEDSRPSLQVNPRSGLWHCFPCDVGGDGIAFVMRHRGVTFADAVRELAAA